MAVDHGELRVELVSPPDRDFLVAAVMRGNEQVAEVNVEQERLSIELYASSTGEPWRLDLAEVQHALEEAGRRIRERTGRG
jgi:hypothetical protein